MSFFGSLAVASSGMQAQRLRLDIISSNIANANTITTPEGGPYKRKDVVFESEKFSKYLAGVKVADVVRDDTPPKLVYDPTNPLANSKGYVAYPNINPIVEMVNLLDATNSYQANISAFNAAKQMAQSIIGVLNVWFF